MQLPSWQEWSYFPSWEEMRPLMEGRLGAEEEDLLLERIRNSDTSDPAGQALKGLLERSNYDTSALKKSNLRLRNKISRIFNSPARAIPLKKLAAIFIWVVGISSVIYFMNRSSDFSDAYIHEPGFPVYMSGESSNYNWMERYRAGEFRSALEKINNRIDFNSNDTLKYYAAVIYYEQEKYLESLECLKSITDSAYLEKSILLNSYNYYELNNKNAAIMELQRLRVLRSTIGLQADSLLRIYFSDKDHRFKGKI